MLRLRLFAFVAQELDQTPRGVHDPKGVFLNIVLPQDGMPFFLRCRIVSGLDGFIIQLAPVLIING